MPQARGLRVRTNRRFGERGNFGHAFALAVAVVSILTGCGSGEDGKGDSVLDAGDSDSAECCINAAATLGMNLEKIGPFSRSWVFVDVFKTSSPFRSIPSNQALELDSEGWVTALGPGQHAVTEILDAGGNPPHFDLGPYTLLYDGTGTLSLSGPVSIVSQSSGSIVFSLTPGATSKVMVDLSQTDPADPLRNIRIIMNGFEDNYGSQVFHPDFLQALSPFKVIRFLNWTSSNNSPLVEWSERTLTTSQTQSSVYGVAPEYIVSLSNRLLTDVWINIPHLVSADYIVQLATYLRDNLDPRLRVFVEHSNEIWGEFQQSAWAEQQGMALSLSTNAFEAGIRFHGQRSVAIFRLFEQVFGAGSARIVKVLGAGHLNTQSVTEVMDWQSAYLEADAVATAAYFGGRLGGDPFMNGTAFGYPYAKPIKDMSVSEFLAALDSESQLSDAATVSNQAAIESRGLAYITYEGGPATYFVQGSSWATQPVATDLFQAACRDAGIKDVTLANMTRWRTSSAGGLYMAFNHISNADAIGSAWYSCWGSLEYVQQGPATAPKWQALMEFLDLFPNP